MTDTALPYPELAPARRRAVAWWLGVWSVMLLLIVVIGGVTRLTESGLSITEWAPVTGAIPPLTEEAWSDVFRAYQQIPEYQQLNRGMTLAEFKNIFFWEYLHRLWARLIGVVFFVPLVYFLVRGGLPRGLTWRLGLLLALTAAQGALGWFMVMSGLAERTDVSQYRLAAHLGLALIIYVVAVWTAADLFMRELPRASTDRDLRVVLRFAGFLVGLVFVAAIAGAFVAGLDGGRVYNTFPLMGGRLVPSGYMAIEPWWRNVFENVIAVQFNHRVIGIVTLFAVAYAWFRGVGADLPSGVRRWLDLLPLVAVGQVALGVATLLLVAPVWLAALHQAGAVILLTASLLLFHGLARSRI
ncbi:MAG TPA: COX15/CtaA family protein [Gemmatimonadales bacterium]|jgi:cytochrome c oxidase assembly protein subunit 15